ncbi:DnaE-like DNA polymerase III alpha [Rhodococcus phage Braxoaddie]|nr:DnaE-like DNA polymerase III alpha [Rhodococcus phage Braxoaddie]
MHWVSLHTHTTHSYGDGFGTVPQHFSRMSDLGMTAAATTEHRSTSSHPQWEQEARKHGIKPIYGCEFDVAMPNEPHRRHFHQTVLAMDEEGYRNLNRLTTLAWQQTKYVPRLYVPQLLDPKLTKGLIVLSGCADSFLSCTILGGKSFGDRKADWEQEDIEAGRILVEKYQEVYGDRYYLECQQFPQLERSTILNQAFMDISAVTGVKAAATADVHYPFAPDNEMQRLLHAAHRGGTVATQDADWEYNIALTYPESDDAIYRALVQQELTYAEAEAAVMSTAEIAERCTVELPKSSPIRYTGTTKLASLHQSTPEDDLAATQLMEWIERGIDYRLETNPAFAARWYADEDGYLARVRSEFDVIKSKGFCDYFLVTADIVQWAKDVKKMGVGPGRGSAAGSLLCFVIRITEIDPMQFPLMQFERFIDPSRPDMPDIDLDFSDPAAVFAYGAEKYGAEHVAHIGNFTRYRGKTAVNDVARVYEIPFDATARFNKMIVDRPDGDPRENDSVADTIDGFLEAREIADKYPELRLAARLEGQLRGLGVHAAGMVISNRPITDTCAVYSKTNSKGEKVEVIAYDKRDAEYLGMLKLDILGLQTMTILEDVVAMVPDLTFEKLYAMPLDDRTVLAGFAQNDLTGIFQFEGRTTRSIVEQVFEGRSDDPRFLTLADINALSRPGSLISGMTARYVGVEQGRKKPRDYGYSAVNDIMSSTNGCLVYQEQVMAMGRAAGMPGERVGALRRIIGKKKAGGAFDEFWSEFRDGMAAQHGMPEADAKELWDFMAASSSYLFNIAHAVSYAVIAYWAMWAKTYHPTEFYVASLRYAKTDEKDNKALALMQDAVRHRIRILPPDLEKSGETWVKVGKDAALAGFLQIDGIGDKVAAGILDWRAKERERREPHAESLNAPWNWSDLRYVPPKRRLVRVPCTPYEEEVVRTRTWKNPETGEKEKVKVKVMVERDYRKEPQEVGEASGVRGIGEKAIERIEAFTDATDPFGIHAASDAVGKVRYAIEDGLVPLAAPTADANDLPKMADQQVVFVGLVKEVRLIDVIEDTRKRTNQTAEEVRAELRDPHLTTKAKLICVDEVGTDVHVNVHRWMYPEVKADLEEINPGRDVVHVVGLARSGFGPTVQAQALVPIDPES